MIEPIFLAIVVILAVLAVSDLIVGVSNDAVNFLNSAVGSKAASRKVIMSVAAVGIFVGVLTSSGMMEVARSGIFHPQMFSFSDIMMLFLAVMLTDVILLDVFNTLGLPTSTTVSLVFELLGAAVCVALFTISDDPAQTVANLPQYINSGKALGIISGILVSVVIAFVCGTVVMYITRLIFSYNYSKKVRSLGSVWCGIALTAITYFALFKGLKGTPVFPQNLLSYVNDNIWECVTMAFIFWTIVMWVLASFRINILRITVLSGTFALALAFAGNDLVNFIGVFMAGFDSYKIASAAGDSSLYMGALNQPVHANLYILLISGLVMVLTLWFSKKARRVTDTEVNLAKQDSSNENFGSTTLSRSIVRQSLAINRAFRKILPEKAVAYINRRFEKPSTSPRTVDAPAFDMIRATVNLTVASLLISLATSLKLPLSTTYVTFMVAMGSSLSDRAWGRESAVYRITGVMTVIMGWFLTAFVAFMIAFTVAAILMWGGIYGMAFLLFCCMYLIIHSARVSRRKRIKEEYESKISEGSSLVERCVDEVVASTKEIISIYNSTLEGVFKEDRRELKTMLSKAKELHEHASSRKYNIVATLNVMEENKVETAHYYVQVVDYLNEITKSVLQICKASFEHIDNNHEGLTAEQINDLRFINGKMNEVFEAVDNMLVSKDFTKIDEVIAMRDAIFESFAEAIKNQIKRNRHSESTTRGSILYLNILTEDKIMVLQMRNLLKSQKYFLENV